MSIVIQFTAIKRQTQQRPKNCPHCQGETFQRWGQVRKALKDPRIRSVRVYRYRCTSCRKTFRHYPEGVDRSQQSVRMKQLAVLCWALGLSYRGIEQVLRVFGIELGRMSSWRDVQAQAEQLRQRKKWQSSRVVGIDGAWLHGQGVLVAVDMGDGQPLAIGRIDEKNRAGVLRWLKSLKQRHGIGAIVTDDLAMYRSITEELQLGHQVCQFHVRRWVGKACRDLEPKLPQEYQWMIAQIKTIIRDLSPQGDRKLLEMYKQIPVRRQHAQAWTALDELRHLLIRLSENWTRYTAFFHDPGIPWTNNRTEQAIGRMKNRAKRVRGYKTKAGLLNGLLISSSHLS